MRLHHFQSWNVMSEAVITQLSFWSIVGGLMLLGFLLFPKSPNALGAWGVVLISIGVFLAVLLRAG
jgi:hypothetical protein